MKKLFLIVLCSFVLCSFAEDKMYWFYRHAIERSNCRGIINFVVITATDLNTGKTREYCTGANFLLRAIHKEYGLEYDTNGQTKADSIAISQKDLVFQFKDTTALRSIDMGYSADQMNQLQKEVNFDSISGIISSGRDIWIPDDKRMSMYAHILFKRGIGTCTSTCDGGSLMLAAR